MSKTIKIPTWRNPYEVEINGVRYSYEAGTEQVVNDGVAAVIQQDIDAHTNTAAPQLVQPRWGKVVGQDGEYVLIPSEYIPILVVAMKYSRSSGGKEYYTCDTSYDEIAAAVGKKAVVAWYGGTQVFAKKTGDIISFTGLVQNGDHQYEWYYSTNA